MLRGLNKNGGSLLNIGWDIQTNRIQTFPRIIKKKLVILLFIFGGGRGDTIINLSSIVLSLRLRPQLLYLIFVDLSNFAMKKSYLFLAKINICNSYKIEVHCFYIFLQAIKKHFVFRW